MSDKIVLYLIILLGGIILGFLLCDFTSESKTEIRNFTKIETDTVYIDKIDTVFIKRTDVIHTVIRDTVLIKPIEPKIKAFTASKPFLHGNVFINGEVLGEVLRMDIYQNFKLPTVINTITNTKTIIKKPSGLFLTAGVSYNFSTPYVGGVFIKDRYLFGLNTNGFQIGYKLER
jgi:hypothetical protein